MRLGLILMTLTLAACTSNKSNNPESPGLGSAHSIQMTTNECAQAQGVVVGDIGDGRIHRQGYLCENGEVPLGTIVFINSDAIPVEGAVCCSAM